MVQEFISNLLLTIINRIFQNTTHLYYAIGATVLVLVASYFIYKWYFAAPPVKKSVAFEVPEHLVKEQEQEAPIHDQAPELTHEEQSSE